MKRLDESGQVVPSTPGAGKDSAVVFDLVAAWESSVDLAVFGDLRE